GRREALLPQCPRTRAFLLLPFKILWWSRLRLPGAGLFIACVGAKATGSRPEPLPAHIFSRVLLERTQVHGCDLAVAAAFRLVGDFLAFAERLQPGALHGRNMHKHVRSAFFRLNKPISFLTVEPLHGAVRHSGAAKAGRHASGPDDRRRHQIARWRLPVSAWGAVVE